VSKRPSKTAPEVAKTATILTRFCAAMDATDVERGLVFAFRLPGFFVFRFFVGIYFLSGEAGFAA
jgi:hypothetical protein